MNLYDDNARFQRIDIRNLSKESTMPEGNVNDPSNAAVKPAWKSTEFALSTAAILIGLVLASGILSPEDPSQAKALQILGLIASVLSSLGYTAARTSAKNRAVEVAGAIALEKVRASVPPVPAEPSK